MTVIWGINDGNIGHLGVLKENDTGLRQEEKDVTMVPVTWGD